MARSASATAAPNSPLHALLLPRDSLRPPSAEGPGIGIGLSLLAHAALVAALVLGLQWHTGEPAGVTAELWAAVPQSAAPRTVESDVAPPPLAAPPVRAPAPPPPDTAPQPEAQIAIERTPAKPLPKPPPEPPKPTRQELEKADRRQAEQDAALKKAQAKAQAQAEAQQRKADEDKLAKLRAENLQRMLGQAGQANGSGAPQSTGTAARDAGPSASYAGRIKGRVKPNIVLTDDITGNPTAEVEVRCAPDGTIIGRRIVKSSGVKEWDDTVLRAIDRTGVLPRDVDGRMPSPMVISFRPME